MKKKRKYTTTRPTNRSWAIARLSVCYELISAASYQIRQEVKFQPATAKAAKFLELAQQEIIGVQVSLDAKAEEI